MQQSIGLKMVSDVSVCTSYRKWAYRYRTSHTGFLCYRKSVWIVMFLCTPLQEM